MYSVGKQMVGIVPMHVSALYLPQHGRSIAKKYYMGLASKSRSSAAASSCSFAQLSIGASASFQLGGGTTVVHTIQALEAAQILRLLISLQSNSELSERLVASKSCHVYVQYVPCQSTLHPNKASACRTLLYLALDNNVRNNNTLLLAMLHFVSCTTRRWYQQPISLLSKATSAFTLAHGYVDVESFAEYSAKLCNLQGKQKPCFRSRFLCTKPLALATCNCTLNTIGLTSQLCVL